MIVHHDLAHLPKFKNAVVTIGTFDGVHAGHQQILAQLKQEAAAVGGETVIITFHPHPRKVVKSHAGNLWLLNTLDEKIDLLKAAGIDHLVVVPFTPAFSQLSAEDYVQNFLVKYFLPHTLVIGYDHRFGHDRTGNFKLLESLGVHFNFKVKEISEQLITNVTVSSTRIRQAILQGKINEANAYLGYAYFFEGKIIEGNKLGRTIGFPTANIAVNHTEKLIPGNGVYAVEATVREFMIENKTLIEKVDNGPNKPLPVELLKVNAQKLLKGMMNIGTRPTVDGTKTVIEVNIFDFDADIYGKTLRVLVHYRLRDEVKFTGLDALKTQLANDRKSAKSLLQNL